MPQLDLQTLSADLSRKQARWQARPTPQSTLDDLEKRTLLGVVVDQAALATAMAPSAGAPPAPGFAPAVDWRSHGGNHITPVKNQKNCGSCVSYCATAVIESMASIEKGQLLDLSEADLHFCSSHGASCGGWWPDQAYAEAKTRGIVSETVYPYMRAFDEPPRTDPASHMWIPHCEGVRDRGASAVRITNAGTMANVVDRKNYLSSIGPCSAVLHVFDDFYAYGSGVYHHVSGADQGLHCVEVIGYSEAEHCWICKNSWGTDWGDNGFFKIAYGEAGIDSEFPFWNARGVVLPALANAVGEPFGYAFIGNGVLEQHNLFRSADGHIHALWFNFAEGWHREDRTAMIAGTPPAVDDPYAYTFSDPASGLLEQHHLLRSADGHIHALWFNFATGWHHEDRSAPFPGIARAASRPTAYTLVHGPIVEQHNLFRSGDGHIHALWFNFAEGWHHEDRSALLPGVPAAAGEPFGYAFVDHASGLVEQHNLFRSAADGHVHALWFNFTDGWHHEDRSLIVPGVPAARGNPSGYTFIGGGVVEQHNLFRSSDGHIHALWFNFSSGWHHEDRTAMLPGVPPAVGDPFGYTFINEATGLLEQHNLFRSADGHIHALWFNFAEGWHHEDRTAMLPGVPNAVSDPVGYSFVDGDIVEQHNLFRSADGHIHALWFNFSEGWHHEERR